MRTGEAIDARKGADTAAFIGYLPAGFPDGDLSVRAVKELAAGGADIIEIGLPYSDPTMDGGTIQVAGQQALKNGFRVRDVFRHVEAVANAGVVPLIMTYYNLVFRYGVDDFARDFANAGGAGLITPDLIPDEAGDWIAASDTYDLDRIFLVAQSSRDRRLAATAAASRGFVYAASTMGVTGTRDSLDAGARSLVERTRAAGAERVCLGIGVSTPEQAREVAGYADGVIVGSALVRCLFDQDEAHALSSLRDAAEQLAAGAHGE
ncbi:MAG: tryptophan synthase subunit alpha [Ancrocorticia sp.]|uniref:tryptophan synthase subunit alpha n=1 Tax=Ancrocorticia sp. TaxID=2593684 RepID=UPI003F9057BA